MDSASQTPRVRKSVVGPTDERLELSDKFAQVGNSKEQEDGRSLR